MKKFFKAKKTGACKHENLQIYVLPVMVQYHFIDEKVKFHKNFNWSLNIVIPIKYLNCCICLSVYIRNFLL